jgi:hypothetical protein
MTKYLLNNAAVTVILGIWLCYLASLLTLGLLSQYPELTQAILYDGLFVMLVVLPPVFFPLPLQRIRPSNKTYLMIVVVLGLLLSAVAILCLSIDKWHLAIDYSKGICIAREQMTQLGKLRKGISSPYSFVGNLLGLAFFAPLAVVLTQNVSRFAFWTVTLLSFTLMMTFSAVAASRSPIILFAAFAVGMICFRLVSKPWWPRITLIDACGCAVIFSIAAMFILSVFQCRASNSHMSELQYRDNFAQYLGVKPNLPQAQATPVPTRDDGSVPARAEVTAPAAAPSRGEPSAPARAEASPTPASSREQQPVSGRAQKLSDKARGLLGLTALYFGHSALTFAAILSAPPEDSRILFAYAQQLLSRVGLAEPPQDWMLAGRFASLPGGLWHDFGLSGMCLGAIIIGLGIWGARCAARAFSTSIILAGISSAVFAIAFLSPIHFAGEIAQFPFVCFSLIVIPALANIISSLSSGRGYK